MSKKLLNEATVRKFMKLANLANLSPTFLKEMQDEKVHEGGDMYEGEYMEEGGLYEEEDAMDDEMGDEPEMGDEGEDDGEELAVAVLSAVADVFKERGVDIDVEGAGDEDEMGDEPDMGDEEDLMSPDEDEEGEEPPADEEDEEGPLQEAIFRLLDKSGIEIVDDQALTEAVVKRVAARVARRLLKESL